MTLKHILVASAIAVSFMAFQATAYDHHEGEKTKVMKAADHGKDMMAKCGKKDGMMAKCGKKDMMAKCADKKGEEKAKCAKHAKKMAKKHKEKHVKDHKKKDH